MSWEAEVAALAVSWRSPFLGVWDDEMVSRGGGGAAAAAAVLWEGEKVASSCFPFCKGKTLFFIPCRDLNLLMYHYCAVFVAVAATI